MRGNGESTTGRMPSSAPMVAIHRVGPQADRGPEQAAGQRADGPDAVVHGHERAGEPGPDAVGHHRLEDRGDRDVEQHHAQARAELGQEQHRQHQPVRAAGQRHQQQRRREQRHAEHVGRADAHPPGDGAGDDRSDHPADRTRAQHQAERARLHVQLAVRVQHEQGGEREVEQVHGGGAQHRGAQRRRAQDEPDARGDRGARRRAWSGSWGWMEER